MLWLILLVLVVTLLWFHFMKPFNYWREKGVPQTSPWPFVGDSWPQLLRRKANVEVTKWLYNMYPDKRYFGFYNFKTPNLAIRDPELIKRIAVKDFDHFLDHVSFIDPRSGGLFARILFFLKGQEWKDVRSPLSGAFTSSKMKYMFGIIKAASEKFANHFDQQNKDFVELEVKDTYTRFANDVIASAAFGLEVDSFKNPENHFFLAGKTMFNNGGTTFAKVKYLLRLLMPQLLLRIVNFFLSKEDTKGGPKRNYFENVIYETIEVREQNNIKRSDMINILLELKHGVKQIEETVSVDTGYATVEESEMGKSSKKNIKIKEVTNEFIASQAVLFFVAGFDTVSTAMSFGTYELALNPHVQDKLRKEIRDTFAKCDGNITYEILLKMKYMDMVVSEILRKWHPAPTGATDRVCTKPYTIEAEKAGEKDLHLKIGDVIFFPYCAIQTDPKYWPEPEKFDPERFSDENKGTIIPYTYFPFGVGPRNCIGNRFALLEVKCMLLHILRNYEFVRTQKTEVPLTLQKGSFQNTAENGFWLGLRRVA